MSYNCCPHCGASIGQSQTKEQKLICASCGKEIGLVTPTGQPTPEDPTEALMRRGMAARCSQCQQVVAVKGVGKTLAVHYAAGPKKICPGSGKPPAVVAAPGPSAAIPSRTTPGGRDLSKYYTRDLIRVILCQKDRPPQIEELTLEYLDKADRVRIQIEALREILGPSFRMKDYPAALNRPQLAVWGHATACVIARKHERGGYEPMAEAEIAGVLGDVKNHETFFFG